MIKATTDSKSLNYTHYISPVQDVLNELVVFLIRDWLQVFIRISKDLAMIMDWFV